MERKPLQPALPATYAKKPRQAEAWRDGWARGYYAASAVTSDLPPYGREVWSEREGRVMLTPETVHELIESLAFEAEEHDRQYSPFEMTASAFNRARNSEALWSAFDEGIADGIFAYMAAWQPPVPC